MNLKNRWLFFILTYLYAITLYIGTNHFHYAHARMLPLTPLDIKIPFWPSTSWIYVAVYIFPLAVGFLVDQDQEVKTIVFAFVAMATLCALIFIFYPTIYPRPPLPNGARAGGLWLVRFLDTPANCIPSEHVALGFLSAFFIQRYQKNLGNISLIVSVLIAVSTLTTKQHYVWDVLAGYFVARLTFMVASLTLPRTRPAATRFV